MPALIDNYTTTEPTTMTRVNHAKFSYKTEIERMYSSITITSPNQLGLNYQIHMLLDEYTGLKNNWDENDAVAPGEAVFKRAKYVTSLLEKHGQRIFHAAPGPNGEIMLDIRNSSNTKSLEVIFYSSKSVAVLFPSEGKPSQRPFLFSDLPELLTWLNQK